MYQRGNISQNYFCEVLLLNKFDRMRIFMTKNEKFIVRALKGIGYGVISEVMCIFLVLSMVVINQISGGIVWLKLIIGIFTMIITLGLYFNWAFNAAKRDRDLVKFHGVPYDRYMPLKMAVIAPIISYVSLILLILSKMGVIPDIFNVFLLLNLFTLPFVDCFTAERTIEFVSVPGLLGIALLVLSQGAVIAATYIMTYRDVDVIKFMYKNDK